jgi:hypothetical protein
MNVKFALFAGLLLSVQAFALDNTANQTKPTNDVPTQADIQRLFDEEVKAINRNMIINNPMYPGDYHTDMLTQQMLGSMQYKAKINKAVCQPTDKPNTYDCLVHTTSNVMGYQSINKSAITVKRIGGELVLVK